MSHDELESLALVLKDSGLSLVFPMTITILKIGSELINVSTMRQSSILRYSLAKCLRVILIAAHLIPRNRLESIHQELYTLGKSRLSELMLHNSREKWIVEVLAKETDYLKRLFKR